MVVVVKFEIRVDVGRRWLTSANMCPCKISTAFCMKKCGHLCIQIQTVKEVATVCNFLALIRLDSRYQILHCLLGFLGERSLFWRKSLFGQKMFLKCDSLDGLFVHNTNVVIINFSLNENTLNDQQSNVPLPT